MSKSVPSLNDGCAVVVDSRVMHPADLELRIADARVAIDAAHLDVAPSGGSFPLEHHAHRLHQLYAIRYAGPPERAPGVRGRVSFEVKRAFGRLQSWEADAQTARMATDVATAVADLQVQVEHLQEWNARLQREVRRLRRQADAGDHSR